LSPLAQLAIIWAGVFVAGLLATKTRLTSVLYYLAFGALMVNLNILPGESAPFIRDFAELGIILIMFALGFEENTRTFLRSIKRSWGIAFFGALAPFTVAYFIAQHFYGDTNIAIMCGLTMTATAVSLTMVSLKGLGLSKSRAATGIMTSAVLDDIASLALVAILVPMASGQAALSVASVLLIGGKAILFFGGVAMVGIFLLPHDMSGWMSKIPIIGHYGVRDLITAGKGEHSTLTIILFALVVGLAAHEFGFHPAVGAYMAGLILSEEYFLSDSKTAHSSHKRARIIVDNAAFSWIGPVFFVDLGTKIVLDWDIVVAVIPQTALLLGGVFVAQIVSAALAARYTGNFEFHESLMIGFGMLGRAELAFVVMDIAYVQNNIFTTEVFYMLMFTTFWLNVSVPVTITLWKPHYLRGEAARLGEEEASPG
jgi:Kef-type K+ transport system membrane component KefB